MLETLDCEVSRQRFKALEEEKGPLEQNVQRSVRTRKKKKRRKENGSPVKGNAPDEEEKEEPRDYRVSDMTSRGGSSGRKKKNKKRKKQRVAEPESQWCCSVDEIANSITRQSISQVMNAIGEEGEKEEKHCVSVCEEEEEQEDMWEDEFETSFFRGYHKSGTCEMKSRTTQYCSSGGEDESETEWEYRSRDGTSTASKRAEDEAEASTEE